MHCAWLHGKIVWKTECKTARFLHHMQAVMHPKRARNGGQSEHRDNPQHTRQYPNTMHNTRRRSYMGAHSPDRHAQEDASRTRPEKGPSAKLNGLPHCPSPVLASDDTIEPSKRGRVCDTDAPALHAYRTKPWQGRPAVADLKIRSLRINRRLPRNMSRQGTIHVKSICCTCKGAVRGLKDDPQNSA